MRAVREIISDVEKMVKARGQKGYQALSRTFAQLRGKRRATAGNLFRKSARGKGGGQS